MKSAEGVMQYFGIDTKRLDSESPILYYKLKESMVEYAEEYYTFMKAKKD